VSTADDAPAAAVTTAGQPFPYVPFRTIAERNGVALRAYGEGTPLIFMPGMTGGGQATLELAVRVAEQTAAAGRPLRLLLVDYTSEDHPTFDALRDTVEALVTPALGGQRTILWTESLGCLVTPSPRFDAAFNVHKRVMISAFGDIPQLPLRLGLVGMAIAPPPLFRWVMGPMGRWTFGPPGDSPDHVFFKSLQSLAPKVTRRRSAWLVARHFQAWFQGSTVPTKLWLGALDRLVGIERQRSFFGELAAQRPDFQLSIVEGGGHVVTDTRLVAQMVSEITPWVLS